MSREIATKEPRDLEEEIINMCYLAKDMLEATWEGFRKHSIERLSEAEHIGREIHEKEKELTYTITHHLSYKEPHIEKLALVPGHIERIGDNIELLIRCIKTMIREGIPFSERAIKEINTLFTKCIELIECLGDVIKTRNRVLVKYIIEEGKKFQDMVSEYALAHQERLIEGTCLSKASSIFLAMLDYLTEIERHIRQITGKVGK